MKRVIPYGIGKTFIQVRLDELPRDIQEGIIGRYECCEDKSLKVTKYTTNVVIVCEAINTYNCSL